MVDWLLKILIGGKSKRHRFMILYWVTFIVLSLTKTIDFKAFGIFTTPVMLWLGVETYRKGDD